ncbi:MAG: hypothetical protein JO076_08190 [Verrucomicrobia bacterium]|nr:hypothetical protein [Verrucomicrobiota bacterium]
MNACGVREFHQQSNKVINQWRHACSTGSGKADLAPAWRSSAPVLCVAGSGPLDQAASSMLAQLVRKHGLGARVIPHEITSPERLPAAVLTGSVMVCISYLQLSCTPAYLEYLVRRLRRRLPAAALLVGLWPGEDLILSDVRLRAALRADYYTSSLREAVEACLEAARNAAAANPSHK